MRTAIIAELTLTQSTLATRRNVQKLLAATDLADASRVAIQNIVLAPNGGDLLDDADSMFEIGDVEFFLHLATTAPVRLTFTALGETSIDVQRHFTVTAAMTSVLIVNRSLTETVTIKVISA